MDHLGQFRLPSKGISDQGAACNSDARATAVREGAKSESSGRLPISTKPCRSARDSIFAESAKHNLEGWPFSKSKEYVLYVAHKHIGVLSCILYNSPWRACTCKARTAGRYAHYRASQNTTSPPWMSRTISVHSTQYSPGSCLRPARHGI